MTIQPGSLDYLYYNGIIDHIPYEAYASPIGQPYYAPAYNSNYLDTAKSGYAYQYGGSDCFVPTNPVSVNNYYKTPIQELKEQLNEDKNKAKSSPVAIKGLLASGIVATTLAILIKRVKKH